MILITGGAGYIGSHTNKILNQQGYKTVIFDNLERGHLEFVKWGKFFKGDLRNIEDIRDCFKKYPNIKAVIHFAAYAYVGESVQYPDMYYENNVLGTLNLLRVMQEFGVNNMVFSSSCATYGIPRKIPISEDIPQNPINSYGKSKLLSEQIIKDFAKSYGLKYIILRYFNAAGADPDCEIGEWHEPETHLIPLTIFATIGKTPGLKIYGSDYPTKDGTCIRDYIHVMDLANAHLKSLEYLLSNGESDEFNVGLGRGYSVKEIVAAVEKVVGKVCNYDYVDRRAGDPPILIASNEKIINKLKRFPKFDDIELIIKTAYEWHIKSL